MYYVYAHVEADTGRVFYVGKGIRRRAWTFGGRSSYWKCIRAKHGLAVQMLETGLKENEAFMREVQWIAYFRSIGLCRANVSNGGDGVRVTVHWWGPNISKSMKRRYADAPMPTGEQHPSYKHFSDGESLRSEYNQSGLTEMAKRHGVSIPTIAARLREYNIPVRSPGLPARQVKCTNDGMVFDSVAKAAKFYGVERVNIRNVINGKYKHTGGKQFQYL